MPESYYVLDQPSRDNMVKEAILQLEQARFEAELNAAMSDEGMEVPVSADETAGERIERLDRQIQRLVKIVPV